MNNTSANTTNKILVVDIDVSNQDNRILTRNTDINAK